jgi:type I restriction enzyme, S subunit
MTTGTNSQAKANESSTLPPLPSQWKWVRFSDICERVSVGHVGPTSKYFIDDGSGVPLIRSQNVRPGRLVLNNVAQITSEFHRKLKKSQLRTGDVLIVRVGANRSDCCFVPDEIGELNCANIVFARPRRNGAFFSLYFQTHFGRRMLLGATTGAAQEVINTTSVASMPVPFPPNTVQERICAILSAYDNLIENNRWRIQLMEEASRLLYKEWFINLRFPGHEHAKIVDGVPEGWSKRPLAEISQLNYGKALKAEDRIPGPFPVYGSSGIVGSHVKALVKGPTIIVGRKGNVGSIRWSAKNCHPIDTVYFIESSRCSLLLYYALQCITFISTDLAVPGLNRDFAHSRLILVPDDKIFRLFEDTAQPIHKQIEVLQDANHALNQARNLLLPRLMNGQVAI